MRLSWAWAVLSRFCSWPRAAPPTPVVTVDRRAARTSTVPALFLLYIELLFLTWHLCGHTLCMYINACRLSGRVGSRRCTVFVSSVDRLASPHIPSLPPSRFPALPPVDFRLAFDYPRPLPRDQSQPASLKGLLFLKVYRAFSFETRHTPKSF